MIPSAAEMIRTNAELSQALVELIDAARALVDRYRDLPASSPIEGLEDQVSELAMAAVPGQLAPLSANAEDLLRQRAVLRSLVRRALEDGIDEDWRQAAMRMVGPTVLTGQGPGEDG